MSGKAMVGLVHLVWAPLGPEPLRRFLVSYRARSAGADHELVVVLNGVGTGRRDGKAARQQILAELRDADYRLIELEHRVLDLRAYADAARRLEHDRLCFLNSHSVVLADHWLAHLVRGLDSPGAGIVGATASCESQAEWMRGKARYWLYQLALSRRSRSDFPRFPNPHIRTTAFMLDRALLLDMGLEHVTDKRSAYLVESGFQSITRQAQERGLRAIVVGRDGVGYDIDEWPRSATYRAGGQTNLLVADNRTRDWELASPRLRRRLSRDAWGAQI